MTLRKARKEDCYHARALYYTAPGTVELRLCDVSFTAKNASAADVLVRALWSGISRGTERLIFQGRVPPSEFERMRAPSQEGEFPFPVKYGYASVGVIERGPAELLGSKVFALHPHQTLFALPAEAVFRLPEKLPERRAVLAANMETALNAMWDAQACPGDRIVIVGAGTLGLLIANLAAKLPGAEVKVCDINPARESAAKAIGAEFVPPEAIRDAEADVVFHASASTAGLEASLAAAGFEARLVELSWYGTELVPAPLGSAFHSRRLRLISSQVGAVSQIRRARWSHRRRLAKALELLCDPRLDALITDEVDFDALPQQMPILLSDSKGIATAVRYR